MNRNAALILILLLATGLQFLSAQDSDTIEQLHEADAEQLHEADAEQLHEADAEQLQEADAEQLQEADAEQLQEADADEEYVDPIPGNVRNNRYYLESIRLTKLAQASYEEGDYDASGKYAEDAIRFAQLSDDYVALQLKIKETNDAIALAKERLDWASSSGAGEQYPDEYKEAQGFYSSSLSFRRAGDWDEAYEAAINVIDILAYTGAPEGRVVADGVLPALYTVTTWSAARDCLWNIAGRPYVYGNPHLWRLIYNANKSKMPEPNNPNLIEPGMVLEIPALKGEKREGMYNPSRSYR